jgi:hypothetical protein
MQSEASEPCPCHPFCKEKSNMENNKSQSHEEREVQTLVDRIEKKEISQKAAKEAETKRTLEDYAKKVGS